MTVEQRELYLFVEGTRPFMDILSQISLSKYRNAKKVIKELVRDAVGTYCSWYCTKGDNPFSKEDIDVVFKEICEDIEGV